MRADLGIVIIVTHKDAKKVCQCSCATAFDTRALCGNPAYRPNGAGRLAGDTPQASNIGMLKAIMQDLTHLTVGDVLYIATQFQCVHNPLLHALQRILQSRDWLGKQVASLERLVAAQVVTPPRVSFTQYVCKNNTYSIFHKSQPVVS